MMVQRYDIDESKGYPSPSIVPDDLGSYVGEEDYAALEKSCEELEREKNEIRFYVANTPYGHWMDRAEKAESDNAELKEKFQQILESEHALSDAYLRLRLKLGAMNTPCAPTSKEIWRHTEHKLDELLQKVKGLEIEIKDYWLAQYKLIEAENAELKERINGFEFLADKALNPSRYGGKR